MSVETPTISVPIRTDEHGDIRVGGTRVLLDLVIVRHQQGRTPEQIQDSFPTLKLADVYAVITYYLSHQEEVDAYIRKRDEEGEQLRRRMEAEHPEIFELQNRLRELAKRGE
ncbi:MAG: DUF433 domain-containing protein [Chloroflexota bacterium]